MRHWQDKSLWLLLCVSYIGCASRSSYQWQWQSGVRRQCWQCTFNKQVVRDHDLSSLRDHAGVGAASPTFHFFIHHWCKSAAMISYQDESS